MFNVAVPPLLLASKSAKYKFAAVIVLFVAKVNVDVPGLPIFEAPEANPVRKVYAGAL